MPVIEIFPKPIGLYSLEKDRHLKLKEQCLSLIEEKYVKDNSYANQENHRLKHFLNKDNLNLFDYEELKWFEKWLEEQCVDYIENILGCDLKDGVVITDCWLNKCDAGGEQFPHIHTNSYISGTYYVNYIDGLHSPLKFKNKNLIYDYCSENPVMMIPFKKRTKYNSIFAEMSYKEGDLLLWESYHSHGFESNMEDNRISISFNVMPRYLSSSGVYGFKIERS